LISLWTMTGVDFVVDHQAGHARTPVSRFTQNRTPPS
jgi:hypothetical protein